MFLKPNSGHSTSADLVSHAHRVPTGVRPTYVDLEMNQGTVRSQKSWTTTTILAVLLVAGLALRAFLAIAFPDIYQADEVFQTLEPAHRLATGWGIVTWEWRVGVRSWLVPGILAGLMSLAGGRDADPQSYLILITIVLSLLSLSIVAVAAAAGRRVAGIHGLAIAGAASAGWYDLVYFGPRTLTEAIAANTLVVAVYLATIVSGDNMSVLRQRRYLMVLGGLLGLTFWLRFHLAPALPFVAAWACRKRVRERWLPLIVAAGVPLASFVITDWLTLGTPLQSVWKNFWINIVDNRSGSYGTAPFYWYLLQMAVSWRKALVPIVAAACIGACRLPLFGLVAVIVIASMSVIPHKEVRFIFPAIALVIVLAAVGTAMIVERLRLLWWPAGPLWLPTTLAILAWLTASAVTATRGSWPTLHSRAPYMIQAENYLHERSNVCGVGLLGVDFAETSGYTRLHLPVPITQFDAAVDFSERASSVNWLLVKADLTSAEKTRGLQDRGKVEGFSTTQCWDQICVMHREGACTPMNGWDINAQLSAWNW
jgi:phosphatidylinositol glycan class B